MYNNVNSYYLPKTQIKENYPVKYVKPQANDVKTKEEDSSKLKKVLFGLAALGAAAVIGVAAIKHCKKPPKITPVYNSTAFGIANTAVMNQRISDVASRTSEAAVAAKKEGLAKAFGVALDQVEHVTQKAAIV